MANLVFAINFRRTYWGAVAVFSAPWCGEELGVVKSSIIEGEKKSDDCFVGSRSDLETG